MAHIPHSLADSALARLFSRGDVADKVSWFSLPGGQALCETGETADFLYFLRAGRLAAIRREDGHQPQLLGVIRPGEPAGEMAMMEGKAHTATVVALRDSEILSIARSDFFAAAANDPAVLIELSRLMVKRARQSATRSPIGAPSVFGFVGLTPDVDARDLMESVAAEIEALGYSVATVGDESISAPTEWFSNVEADHDYVLYAAESDQTPWTQLVGRQVDRLFRVGRGDQAPPAAVTPFLSLPLQAQFLVDLILQQPAQIERPSGSEAWMEAVGAARLFHMRDGHAGDRQRIARTLTGQSVGLVLSGGGARAYAHIGAVQALRESGTPIDFVCGVSMGAIIAAAVAMGWDQAEIDRRIRKAFVDTSPVDDIAFPFVAMILGEKVRARLHEHFADTQISDLWLPFFCVSSNLTAGSFQLHRRGTLRRALRASISIPGLLPPVTQDNNVLVDGAVMKNYPADILRTMHQGPIVGVDVTRGRSITADDVARPSSVWRWILSGDWRKGPPIVSLLIRAATVSTGRDLAASREATDVLVLPSAMDEVELRDWKAYDPAVAAGHAAMTEALGKLSRPVTDLRRRLSLVEQAEFDPPAVAQ